MDTAGAAVQDTEPATPDGDVAVCATLRTTDLDEARDFCRRMYYGPLEVKPAGSIDGFAFTGEVVQISWKIELNEKKKK